MRDFRAESCGGAATGRVREVVSDLVSVARWVAQVDSRRQVLQDYSDTTEPQVNDTGSEMDVQNIRAMQMELDDLLQVER